MKVEPGLAGEIVRRAVGAGADTAEVFIRSRTRIAVEAKYQAVDALSSSHSFGYGLRIIRNNALGFSFSTTLDDLQRVIENALSAAAFTDPDPSLALPEPLPFPQTDVFDPDVAAATDEQAIRSALMIEQAAFEADERITKVRKPAAVFSRSETAIANSLGMNSIFASTACFGQITAIAGEQDEGQTGWEYEGSRRLADISFERIGRTAALNAVRLLGARKAPSHRAAVILDRSVSVDFASVFAASLSAESVQKGKSLLCGRMGTAVMSPGIDIIDSGLVPWALGSQPFDDEGVPVMGKAVISRGVLKSFLHNTHTGRKDGTVSTGNASRGGHASLPSVGITNLMLQASEKITPCPLHDLIRSAKNGLYVTDAMGIHTINRVSGDFSIGVTGLWIENGEIAFPVKEATISGNLLEFFGSVAGIADDFRLYGNVGAPALLVPEVDISS